MRGYSASFKHSKLTEQQQVKKPLTPPKMEPRRQNDIVSREEHEEALLALIEHRSYEAKRLRFNITNYTSRLEEVEESLRDSQSKLDRLRNQTNKSSTSGDAETNAVKIDDFNHKNETTPKSHHQSKPNPQHVFTASSSKVPQSTLLLGSGSSAKSNSELNPSVFTKSIAGSTVYLKKLIAGSTIRPEKSKSKRLPTKFEDIELKVIGTKRKFEQKEHKGLIPLIGKSSSAESVNYQNSNYIPRQHKNKLRSIALCPVNDQLFVTSALDGVINLWKVQTKGPRPTATLLSTTDCTTPVQKRWPEDIAWHPEGKSMFSVYSADSQNSQISITNFGEGKGSPHVSFLEDKPHVKGAINSIAFMPWKNNTSFVTGGTEHAVILWSENGEKKWKPKPLHSDLHTSAVMGVTGMHQKEIVLSVGKDKRIMGYNAHVGREDFTHQVDSKCLSILPNPCDFNLFMVQTGTHEKQLRLFDIRQKHKELHAFGWKQESSESQSALVNQDWSPNGLYITSGSADPVIHIFDIRYNGDKPSQSIQAHQNRVFRAMWHHSVPLLISIASDPKIGLHNVV